METDSLFGRIVDYGSNLLAGPLSSLWFQAWEIESAIDTVARWLFPGL